MKYLTIILFVCFLNGCLPKVEPAPENNEKTQDWLKAAQNYRCSKESMARAESESAYCAANTGHSGAYCYGTAIIRNCKKRIDLQ